MPTKNEYNGYTNYETWNCALWLDNDQGTQEMINEEAVNLVEMMDNPADDKEINEATSKLSQFIENLVDEMQECLEVKAPGMFGDMLNAALREIDYYDIAESQLADPLRESQEAFKANLQAENAEAV